MSERERETEEDGSEYFLNGLVKLEFSFLNFICLFGCLRPLFWPGASVVVALGLFLHGMGILVPQPGLHLLSPALQGRVLTTRPPGKSQYVSFLFTVRTGFYQASWGPEMTCATHTFIASYVAGPNIM